MTELDELYHDLILDHSRSPRNYGLMNDASHSAEGYNPLCGDHFSVFLDIQAGKIERAGFDGQGCAISTSSASLMTETVRGLTPAGAEVLFTRVHALVTGQGEAEDAEDLGKLQAFQGVRNFPLRCKCATLAWHTLRAALRCEAEPVSTE